MSNEIVEAALVKFIARAQELVNDRFKGGVEAPDKIVRDGGDKFLRLSSQRAYADAGKSAYCFVALVDGSNKKLGAWKAGDVFKCDGYKSPARGARGSIFTPDAYGITGYGAEYRYR